eukprot:gene56275-53222_t
MCFESDEEPTDHTIVACPRSTHLHLSDTIVCVALSPDKKHMATASRDGMLILWDSQSGLVIEQLDHPGIVTSCTFSPDEGRYVVSGCQDSICRKYQVIKGQLVHESEKLGRGVVVAIAFAAKVVA